MAFIGSSDHGLASAVAGARKNVSKIGADAVATMRGNSCTRKRRYAEQRNAEVDVNYDL